MPKSFKNIFSVRKYANVLLHSTFKYSTNSICLADYEYEFQWIKSVRVFGRCNTKKKIIYLSVDITRINLHNREAIHSTLLHEIAHAIEYELYGKIGHGKTFKKINKAIGGNGKTHFEFDGELNIKRPLYKYHLTCPVCSKIYHRMKLFPTKKYSCSICSKTYDERYKLQIFQNY